MFDNDNANRRKSSLVPQDIQNPQTTSCFVHQLLGRQRNSRKATPSALIDNQILDKGTLGHGDETHSRLLTKRQLADMATGVRELSKSLGSVRLRLKVNTVFLLVKAHDEALIGLSRELVDWLLSQERETLYIVFVFVMLWSQYLLMLASYVENTLEDNHIFDAKGLVSQEPSREGRLKFWTNELCMKHPHTFDFAVTVCWESQSHDLANRSSWEVMELFFTPAGCFKELYLRFSRLPLVLSAFLPNSIMLDFERLSRPLSEME